MVASVEETQQVARRILVEPRDSGILWTVDILIDGHATEARRPGFPEKNRGPVPRRDTGLQPEVKAHWALAALIRLLPVTAMVCTLNRLTRTPIFTIDEHGGLRGRLGIECKRRDANVTQTLSQARVQVRHRDAMSDEVSHVLWVGGGQPPEALRSIPDGRYHVRRPQELVRALLAEMPTSSLAEAERLGTEVIECLEDPVGRNPVRRRSKPTPIEGSECMLLPAIDVGGSPWFTGTGNQIKSLPHWRSRRSPEQHLRGWASLTTGGQPTYAVAPILQAAWEDDLLTAEPKFGEQAPVILRGLRSTTTDRIMWLLSHRQVMEAHRALNVPVPLGKPQTPVFAAHQGGRPPLYEAWVVARHLTATVGIDAARAALAETEPT